MTNGKRRRAYTAILVLCLLLIAGIGAQIWISLANQDAISYASRYITPEPQAVCPGDTFRYPVDITEERGNSVSRVTEGWCREDGICPTALQNPPVYFNFIEPYSVQAPATRTAPETLTPGDWQLRHCNQTMFSGGQDVTCYAVPVTVLDCKP